MSRDSAYLIDILQAAKFALQYVREKTRQEWLEDIQLQDAVIRRLEIIGEAARRVSDKMQKEISILPWHDMVAMRNLMIHEYDGIDPVVVWNTLQNEPPSIDLHPRKNYLLRGP